MISEANKVPTTEVVVRVIGVFFLAAGAIALPTRLLGSFGGGFMAMLSAWVGLLMEPLVGFVLAFHGGTLTTMLYGSAASGSTPPK